MTVQRLFYGFLILLMIAALVVGDITLQLGLIDALFVRPRLGSWISLLLIIVLLFGILMIQTDVHYRFAVGDRVSARGKDMCGTVSRRTQVDGCPVYEVDLDQHGTLAFIDDELTALAEEPRPRARRWPGQARRQP